MLNKHIIQLDGIRFFGMFSVMIAHWLQWQWGNEFIKSIPFTHGVTLFFVLSGFLISRILFSNRDSYLPNNKGRVQLIKSFYIRRSLRIFPVYYLLIIGLIVINYQNTREIFPWLSTYTLNVYQYTHEMHVGNFNHFWSLAVEEQFYLFWPFVIIYIKPSRNLIAIAAVVSLSLLARFCLYYNNYHWMTTSYSTFSNLDALGLGAMLAYITLYQKEIVKTLAKPIWLYISLFLYLLLFVVCSKLDIEWYQTVFDPLMFSIVSMLIVLRASTNSFKSVMKSILENKFIAYSGKVSYGMYIFHLFIPGLVYWLIPETEFFNSWHPSSKYILFILYYLLTFTLAHFSWRFVERPLNNLKYKFPYIN